MPDPSPSLGSADLDTLAAYFATPDLPQEVMTLAELDGFLAAIAIGPEPIAPDEWLPIIWNAEEPVFADDDQAASVTRAIHGHYDAVVRLVAAGRYMPLFEIGDDDESLPQSWAIGFMTAAGLRLEAWSQLFQSEQDDTIAYPILALCDDENGQPLLELSAKDRKFLLAQAPDLIAQAVIDIAGYWQDRNKPPPAGAIAVRTTPKIGRNDPCPCGSGKKYKKCCGA